MYTTLSKFKLQHKLKDTWSVDESKLLEKLLYMDETDLLGSVQSSKSTEKDSDMVSK